MMPPKMGVQCWHAKMSIQGTMFSPPNLKISAKLVLFRSPPN